MTQHTPGKWRVGKSSVGGPTIYDDKGNAIADIRTSGRTTLSGEGQQDTYSRARLIAAAPMLLEALQAVYVTCDWHTEDGLEAMKLAKAAIAAATGEQA